MITALTPGHSSSLIVTTNENLTSRNHVALPQCLIATSKTIFGHNMTAMHDGKNLQEIAQRALSFIRLYALLVHSKAIPDFRL